MIFAAIPALFHTTAALLPHVVKLLVHTGKEISALFDNSISTDLLKPALGESLSTTIADAAKAFVDVTEIVTEGASPVNKVRLKPQMPKPS